MARHAQSARAKNRDFNDKHRKPALEQVSNGSRVRATKLPRHRRVACAETYTNRSPIVRIVRCANFQDREKQNPGIGGCDPCISLGRAGPIEGTISYALW